MAAVDPNATESVIERAADRQVQSLLEAAWAVRDAAEVRRKTIRQALENLAAGLCAFEINAQRLTLAEMDDNTLYKFIGHTAKAKIDDGVWYRIQYEQGATAAGQPDEKEKTARLTDQLTQAQHELAQANRRNADLRAELERVELERTQAAQKVQMIEEGRRRAENMVANLQQQVNELRSRLAQANAPVGVSGETSPVTDTQPPIIPTETASVVDSPSSSGVTNLGATIDPTTDLAGDGDDEEAETDAESVRLDSAVVNLATWKSSPFYPIDLSFLALIGSSYECRRSELFKEFNQAQHGAISKSTQVLLIRRLFRLKLIHIFRAKSQYGRPAQLLALTPAGIAEAKADQTVQIVNIYLLYQAKHKSDTQIRLMLEVVSALEAAGYQVERFPPTRTFSGGRIFDPDLLVSRGTVSIYIELETDGLKSFSPRTSKWRNIAEGTGGYIYVVKYSERGLNDLRSEIAQIDYKHPVSVGVTSLDNFRRALQSDPPASDLFGDLRVVPARPVTY